MRKRFPVLLVVMLVFSASALVVVKATTGTANTFENTYGGSGSGDDGANSVQQTSDGGYIVAGLTNSFGAGLDDVWVLKLNSAGTIQWQKTYGGSGDDVASSIQQTSDGGYILAGITLSFGAGFTDVWVLKLNSDGGISGACGFIASSVAVPATSTATLTDTTVTATTSTATVSSTAVIGTVHTGVKVLGADC